MNRRNFLATLAAGFVAQKVVTKLPELPPQQYWLSSGAVLGETTRLAPDTYLSFSEDDLK